MYFGPPPSVHGSQQLLVFQSSLLHANFLYFLLLIRTLLHSCPLAPESLQPTLPEPDLVTTLGLDRQQLRLCWLCQVHLLYRKDSEMRSLGEEMFCILTLRQMNPKSGIKKKILVCPFGSCYIGYPTYLDCKAPGYLRSLLFAVY